MDIYLGADREGCSAAPVLICFYLCGEFRVCLFVIFGGVEIRSARLADTARSGCATGRFDSPGWR